MGTQVDKRNFAFDRAAYNSGTQLAVPIHRYKAVNDTISEMLVPGFFDNLIGGSTTGSETLELQLFDSIFVESVQQLGLKRMLVITQIDPTVIAEIDFDLIPNQTLFNGIVNYGGGNAQFTVPVTGTQPNDVAFAQFVTQANPASIYLVEAQTDQLQITASVDPGVSTLAFNVQETSQI